MKNSFNPGLGIFADDSNMKRRTLKEQIAYKLIYMITAGQLGDGDELPSERELSSTLDVSRETVRGAIQILDEKGFVEVSQGARTRVKRPTDGSWKESLGGYIQDYDVLTVTETRQVVEVAVLRSAAIRITEKELERMAALIEDQKNMYTDAAAFHISDREFHSLVYNAGGNKLLAKIAGDVYSYALDVRHTAMEQEGAIERSVHEHMMIYRALKNHDPEAAERAVTGHLDSIYKSTVSFLVE